MGCDGVDLDQSLPEYALADTGAALSRHRLLEFTNVSVGRGTDTPFEVVGAPWIAERELAAHLNAQGLPGVRFVPIRFTPTARVHAGTRCGGINLIVTQRDHLSR